MPTASDRFAWFPLWPVVNGKCGCGKEECASKPGKHPALLWKDLGVGEKLGIPAGFGKGIATGERSGIFVVDLDGDDALVWWADRCAEHDLEPWATYSVDTARGCHLYFNLPDFPVKNSAGALAAGVDVRGEGGYVCAPGSVHVSGHVYAEHDAAADVLDAPGWLLEWPGLRGTVRGVSEAGANAPVPVDMNTPVGIARLRAGALACATMPASVQGENGSAAMWAVAMKLMRELELPIEAAMELVDTVYNPRCSPLWELELVLHKLENARDLSDKPTGPVKTDEEHDAFVARLRATARGLKPGVAPTRRCKNPEHTYSFCPGKDTSAMSKEPVKRLPVDVANMLATHRDWDGVLQFDTFRQRISAVDPPMKMHAEDGGKISDRDVAHIRMWLSCHGTVLLKEDANDVVRAAAECVSFDPIQEMLESFRHARVPGILDSMAAEVFGNVEPLCQDFLKKTIVAAARRALNPGERVDTVLVLVGEQGARKTTFVQELFGMDYVRSQMPDLDSKDASIGLQDFWVVELGEIHKILKADKDSVKEFLSRAYDDFIPRYGHNDVRVPRHTVFIGTTNEQSFLSDATGNRRYWPLIVKKVDLQWVRRNLAAIWGEALYLAELPTSETGGVNDETFDHWFPNEAMVAPAHEAFITTDPWHDTVMKFIQGLTKVQPAEVFVSALGGEIKDFDRSKQMRIADTLKRLGCKPGKSHGKMTYFVPAALSEMEKTGMQKLKDRS